tara:strand:- start:166 stop:444 length:279 start_codon:yes stop_codon:yes gene_type:complete
MDKQNIYTLDRKGIKDYIYDLQIQVKENISKDDDIDKFLDETDIFDEFEGILSDQEFGILVLTVLNNFKSEVILNEILDIIERAIKKKCTNE